MLGLFAEQPGEKQNFIAARFGNISLLAHDDAPLEQPNGYKRPSHIFDMRFRPGFQVHPFSSIEHQPVICEVLPSEDGISR